MIPRGVRQNNFGNIRHGDPWRGLTPDQPDPDFARFESPEYGIRAMAKILVNYKKKYGVDTIREAISRWAPPVENDTDAYVDHVCDRVGFGPDDKIDLENRILLCRVISAIVRHENGRKEDGSDWVTAEQIRAGVALL